MGFLINIFFGSHLQKIEFQILFEMNSTEWKDSISGTILQVAAGTFGVVGTIGKLKHVTKII